MNTQKLIHLWANDATLKLEKRAGNVSCRDGKLYSYRTVIAVRVSDGKGGIRNFVSTCRYSVTTSKHQSDVRRSVWGNEVYYLPVVHDFANPTLPTKTFYAEAVAEALRGFRADTHSLTLKMKDGTQKVRDLCYTLNHYCEVIHTFGTAAQKKLVPESTEESSIKELMQFRDSIDKKKSAEDVEEAVRKAEGVLSLTAPSVKEVKRALEVATRAAEFAANLGGKKSKVLSKLLPKLEAMLKEAKLQEAKEMQTRLTQGRFKRCDEFRHWLECGYYEGVGECSALQMHQIESLLQTFNELRAGASEYFAELVSIAQSWVEKVLASAMFKNTVDSVLNKEAVYAAKLLTVTREAPSFPSEVLWLYRIAEHLNRYDAQRFAEVVTRTATMYDKVSEMLVEAKTLYIAERRKRTEAERDAWLAGETNSLSWESTLNEGILLRVKGAVIETSRHAQVPVSVAKGVWGLIQSVMRKGEALTHDFGECASLGSFQLREIRPDGSMQVGCHNLPYSSIEYVAKQLGFI